MRHPIVAHPGIDLVRHDGDLGMVGEAGDERVELGLGHDPARGIGRAVDDDQPGLGGDLGQHLRGGEGEALVFIERHRHGLGTREFDHRAIDRKARVRVHDLRPGLAEHHDRKGHGDLATRHDDDVVRIDLDLPPELHVAGHGLA